MIWRGSILLLVYRVGARSDVTVGVWRAVEKGGNGAAQKFKITVCSQVSA
jgi:hypothetical protein